MSPAPAPPPLWQMLAAYWRLHDHLSRAFWYAVWRARWQPSAGWRQTILLFEQQRPPGRMPETVQGFLSDNASPSQVLAVVEALVQEKRLLSRAKAAQIEEAILTMISRDGSWK